MTEWRRASIADLCVRVTSGGTPSRKHPEYYSDANEGVPWVKSQELVGRTIRGTDEHISKSGLQASSAKLLPPDTVLMAMYGANVGQLGYLGISATVNQAICAMVADPNVTDPRFLYYALAEMRQDLIGQAHGAAQQNLSQQLIRPYELRVPDLTIQRRIGYTLSSIDDLIENNRRRVAVLEDMARAIYREWFVRFRFPGHENVDLVDSALGPMPAGWEWSTFGDLVSIGKETVDPAAIDATTPAVGLEHIPRRQITLDDWSVAAAQGSRKAQFLQGDILFGKIRPYFHKVSVAPLDGICSTDAIVIRPKPECWGEAVAVASSDEFVANAVQTSNGTKMPRADWKVISKWPVPIPPNRISESFTAVMRDHLGLAQKLMFESRQLAAIRDLLVPRLVTGQIDVSSLDLDALIQGAVA